MKTYTTQGGEMLDEICFAHYGKDNKSTEVLKVNPHLSNLDFILPAGIKISLPVEPKEKDQAVTLW